MKIRYKLILTVVLCLTVNILLSALAYYVSEMLFDGTEFYTMLGVQVFLILPLTLLTDYILFDTVYKPIKDLSSDMERYKNDEKPTDSEYDEGEIGDLQRKFLLLSQQLDAEKQKQNRIIASISHDIKTPLTSVMGYTELLKNPSLPDARREKYITTIYAKARQIQDIVEEFDDYLSCNLDITSDMEYHDLKELTQHLVNQMRSEFPDTDLTVEYICTTDGYIYCDESKIRRVFTNIFTNAIKHGGAEHPTVSVYVTRQDEYAVFAFTDNGVGVKRDELEKIFEPMYTTDKRRSVAGLGLPICKEIVELHKGIIYAESEVGKYFSVVIKLKTVESPLNAI